MDVQEKMDELLKRREAAVLYQAPRMMEAGACEYCGQVPSWGKGCKAGQPGLRPAADLPDWIMSDTCPDCGAGIGQYHHVGCDLAMCPDCKKQLYYRCACS